MAMLTAASEGEHGRRASGECRQDSQAAVTELLGSMKLAVFAVGNAAAVAAIRMASVAWLALSIVAEVHAARVARPRCCEPWDSLIREGRLSTALAP